MRRVHETTVTTELVVSAQPSGRLRLQAPHWLDALEGLYPPVAARTAPPKVHLRGAHVRAAHNPMPVPVGLALEGPFLCQDPASPASAAQPQTTRPVSVRPHAHCFYQSNEAPLWRSPVPMALLPVLGSLRPSLLRHLPSPVPSSRLGETAKQVDEPAGANGPNHSTFAHFDHSKQEEKEKEEEEEDEHVEEWLQTAQPLYWLWVTFWPQEAARVLRREHQESRGPRFRTPWSGAAKRPEALDKMPDEPRQVEWAWQPWAPIYRVRADERRAVERRIDAHIRPLICHHPLGQLRWALCLSTWEELELWTILWTGGGPSKCTTLEVSVTFELILFYNEESLASLS